MYEEGKKRGLWKTGIVEKLISGRDKVIRGATVRVPSRGKPTLVSRPIQHLYPLEIKCTQNTTTPDPRPNENGHIPRVPKRKSALDSRWKSRWMLDYERVKEGGVLRRTLEH